MKKIILLSFLLIGSISYGQSQLSDYTSRNDQDVAVPYAKEYASGFEEISGVPLSNKRASVLATTGVGSTVYDLQTNGSVDDRIWYDTATGEVALAWTFSLTNDPFNDRGTGYNYNNNPGWTSSPTTRIENVRVGWPSLIRTASSELVIAHTIDNELNYSRRTTAGSGAWTFGNLTSLTDGVLWPRAAVGGANNETVHVVALTTPEANDGSIYKGLDGALVYYRSNDGGDTWNIQDSLLPFQDTATYFGFGGDSYAIDARGNTVVIGVFNDFDPSFILKSTDGGDTWTQTVYLDNNLQDYDPGAAGSISDNNNDNVADTIVSTDNSGSVLIDNNGVAHIFFGRMRLLDDQPALDSASSFFPFTDGLVYWSENLPSPVVIASVPDLNNDGTITNPNGSGPFPDLPLYYTSMVSFPSAGISPEGDIFVSFAGVFELESSPGSNQFYRHMFLIYSDDDGATWSDAFDMTANLSSLETAFGSMARSVDDSIRLIFQVDGEPGLHVRGDEDPNGQNDLIYLTFPNPSRGIGLEERKINSPVKAIFPNPASNAINLNLNITEPGDYQVQLIDATGKVVMEQGLGLLSQGISRETIDIHDLVQGVYVLKLTSGSSSFTERFIKQ